MCMSAEWHMGLLELGFLLLKCGSGSSPRRHPHRRDQIFCADRGISQHLGQNHAKCLQLCSVQKHERDGKIAMMQKRMSFPWRSEFPELS